MSTTEIDFYQLLEVSRYADGATKSTLGDTFPILFGEGALRPETLTRRG